jgi:DNA-binding LacI/PurR family transcriptional regulator
VEEELFELGYKVMLCNSSEQLKKELVYLDMLKNNRVDAVILLTNNDVEKYLDKSQPLVSFDRRFEGIPFVASDNYHGGVLAAQRLLDHGCKKIVFIGDDAQGDDTPVITEVTKRRLGFTNHIKKFKDVELINIEYPLGDYILTIDEVHNLLKGHEDIDGVFAISDAVAAAVITELKTKGKRVPEDVKVIGFDGGRSFLNLGEKITSISQNPRLIAKAIKESIESYYNKEKVEDKIVPVSLENGDTA